MMIKMDNGLVGNMGVTNNNDKAVEFKVKISSKNQFKGCSPRAKGFLFKQSIPATN